MFADIKKDIRAGSIARYMLMPQIMPRIGALYTTGFSQLALLIALVYRAVNILPAHHSVFRPENRRNLSLRAVLAAAANELKFTRSEIDKVIIYFAVLIGLVILAFQFFMVLAFIMMNPALAQTMPTTYAGFFETPQYATDVAYRLLYMVFGVPELFNPGQPVRPFHYALYSLFQLYSIGLMVIGLMVAFYMVFAILTETAQTGVPFGKRYNHVWAPIRFVFAFGLLIPAGYGLNSAQWVTLYAAKFGSDFASRGWIIFNETMAGAYLKNPEERVGWPQPPELTALAAYMMVVTSCEHAHEKLFAGNKARTIEPYLVRNAAFSQTPPTILSKDFEGARDFYNDGDILIRFGEYNPKYNSSYLGDTLPYCGDLIISSGDAREPGALAIQKFYYDTVVKMWRGDYKLREVGVSIIQKYADDPNLKNGGNGAEPDPKFKQELVEQLTRDIKGGIETAVKAQQTSNTWKNDLKQMKERGWGGAGIWYNKIAQINGSLVTAVTSIPQPKSMPVVMEYVKAKNLQQNTESKNPYALKLADGKTIEFETTLDQSIGAGLDKIHSYWFREDTRQDNLANQTRQTNNILIDVINMIFGTSGLFDMCKSANVHPLAQLSILGKGLVEASIRNLALAVGFGAVAFAPHPFIGIAAGAASSLLLTIATMTISMGFILFYVIPFLPFLYFFFAVGGWIKGLFEAMVGVPLWALAHMRIDGEGLPGEAAISGYFLIFEIFLRPILIVFGLLASVVIFAAMVKVLNDIFHLVVVNLAGHDENSRTICGQIGTGNTSSASGGNPGGGGNSSAASFFRGPIDELFFTVLYAIIVYMIGMSCFKLIDLVPNNILRYMNANVSTFNDQQGDPAQGLIQTLSVGGSNIANQVVGIGKNAGGVFGNLGKAAMEMASTEKQGGQ